MIDETLDAKAIFKVACLMDSKEARNVYLNQVCGANGGLHDRVVALLEAHDQPSDFLESPAAGAAATVDPLPIAERPGTTIGRYRLVEKVGEGGMGVVYKAIQTEPVKRDVALKIIKPGMDTREVVARFEAERQALAMMDHQGVAHVLDGGGTESGRPYFVMELVEGTPVTEYCDAGRYSTRERLALFVDVCQAIQHAHQKGVIHRDLKPSNILVTTVDGAPRPKVIDFGIAKAVQGSLTDQSLHTHVCQVMGTPPYMSPEQVQRTGQDVDTRTDVYSLGVVLYELLTGTTPFDRERLHSSGLDEVKRILQEEEPPRPSTRLSTLDAALETVAETHHTDPHALQRELRGELDWIVMKAMEKDRLRRYPSAHDLARDVERYLTEEAVEAHPPTVAYRLKKFTRRNKAPVAAVASVALALLLGAVMATGQAVRATEAEHVAKRQQHVAEQQQRLAEKQKKFAKTQQRLAEEQREATEDILYVAHMRLAQKDWEDGNTIRLHNLLERHLPEPGAPDRRGWEWYYWLSLCHREKMTLQSRSLSSLVGTWSPDGQYIASVSSDEAVIVWDAKTGEKLITLGGRGCSCVAWSPDGDQLAVGDGHGRIRLYAIPSADHTLTIPTHADDVRLVAWSPDGKRLASCGDNDHAPKIWNAKDGRHEQTLTGHQHNKSVTDLSWHPNDGRLATSSCDFSVRIWDATTGREENVFQPHWCEVFAVAWSPDGKRLATSGWGGSNAKVWDTETWEMVFRFDHSAPVQDIAWSSDNARLVTGTWSHDVRVWNTCSGEEAFALRGHTGLVLSVDWRPDGKQLLSASADGTVKIWDAHEQLDAVTHRSRENATINSTTRRTAAPEPILGDSAVWSPTGERAAWRVEEHAVAIGDPTSTEDGLKFDTGHSKVFALAWGPQGKRLATAGFSGEIKLWRVHGWQQLHTLRGHTKHRYVSTLAWTRDGRRLASGGWDQTVKIWDTEEGREICSLIGHTDCIRSVAWSPDGKQVASTSKDGVLKIWDPAIGSEVLSFRVGGHSLMVTWSDDGQRLTARHDETITTWDASSGYQYASSPAYTLDRARELYRRAVRLARSGHASESEEAFKEAFKEARELHADVPVAYLARGKAYEDSGNLAEALADYNEAIGIDPTLEMGYRYRAEIHLRRGDIHEAIKDAKESVKLTPRLWRCWHILGESEYRAKNWKAAREAFAKSRDLFGGDDASNMLFLAMTDWQLGDNDQALHWYRDAVARINKRKGEGEELFRLRGEASKLLGGVPEALWRLSYSDRLRKDGEHAKSLENSRQAFALFESLADAPSQQFDLLGPQLASVASPILFKHGTSLLLAGKDDAAQGWIRQAIQFGAYHPVGQLEHVDLQPKANITLTNMHTGSNNTLAELPRGVHSFAGVLFNIGEGLIHLGGRESKDLPLEVEGISVGKRFDLLYLLHAAQGTTGTHTGPGCVIGQYCLHYEDCHIETVPVVVGQNVGDWWSTHGWSPLSGARVGWIGTTERATAQGRVIRLYVSVWENPRPEMEVVSIDYVSNQTPGRPFCVGMTVESR